MVECSHGNTAPIQVVRKLSECQAGTGRHKCAVCAYEAGKQAALGKSFQGPAEECDQEHASAPHDMLVDLPASQAGPHRHKCAYEAFQEGRAAGEQLAAEEKGGQEPTEPLTESDDVAGEDIAEEQEIARLLADASLKQTEKEQLVMARRGQGEFRRNVQSISEKCRLTDIAEKAMLIASHIKPWRDCSNAERLDGYNGFLLAPHVDHLFDKGWISFGADGKLMVSKKLDVEVLKAWGITNDQCSPALDDKHLPYLEYHRKEIFRK
ncbi:HNH endonuclease [Qipengyuania huizhouensis]|uniref:HNH endonuclease n=1 Tax=Qipengyuania huizhouensis TaxID=2867245 RepID=UPI001C872997|nr:HNH endonuclease [Qipengyuania huizhouensis]MBX7459839.1 HNH endonuclease [Qipengyuania huizhouensis]